MKSLAPGRFHKILKVLLQLSRNIRRVLKRWLITSTSVLYNQPTLVRARQKARIKKILRTYYDLDGSLPKGTKQVMIIASEADTHPKSSAFIRLISPLTTTRSFKIHLSPQDTIRVPHGTDICIVQRTAFSSSVIADSFIKSALRKKVPVIFDTDDAFSLLDPSHPEYAVLSKMSDAVELIASQADSVWASTPKLVSMYRAVNPNTFLIENSLDSRLWSKPKLSLNEKKPLQILYMGTATHDNDFMMVMPALEKLAKTYPGSFNLTVIGVGSSIPERTWITRLYQPRHGSIYPLFVTWFLKQGPFDVGLAPLVTSSFNECKSDIKCLDYLAAGVIPVVSDCEAYKTPALSEYIIRVRNTSSDWETILQTLIKDPVKFRKHKAKLISMAHDYIRARRSATQKGAELKAHIDKVLDGYSSR